MSVKHSESVYGCSTIFMPTIRLQIPHTSVMFKLHSSIPASNAKLNRCYHFLQVAHSECMTCQIAVSIWSPHSWIGKRWHSGPWLLRQAWGQAGRRRSKGPQSHNAPPPPPSWLQALCLQVRHGVHGTAFLPISVMSCLVTSETN